MAASANSGLARKYPIPVSPSTLAWMLASFAALYAIGLPAIIQFAKEVYWGGRIEFLAPAALIVTVSSSDTRFRITTGGGTTTIPPRGKLVVKVSCEPTAAGALTGALQVASSDPAKPSAATQLKAVGK